MNFKKETSYWLCLWWWAAKWFAHVWVIKAIEEGWIKVSEISWTSMWAIIWACLAFGKSSSDMLNLLSDINFLKLIDINLKTWIVLWNKVKKLLLDIFWDVNIENSNITLKIVSTKLSDWTKVVFSNWSLVDALMASICLPTIFEPYLIGNDKYLDWGLKENLPISVLNSTNVISISVLWWFNGEVNSDTKFLNFDFKKSFISYNAEIIEKTIDILMLTNESNSLNSNNKKNINHISLDLSNYKFYDFLKYKEIIELGYDLSKKNFIL